MWRQLFWLTSLLSFFLSLALVLDTKVLGYMKLGPWDRGHFHGPGFMYRTNPPFYNHANFIVLSYVNLQD